MKVHDGFGSGGIFQQFIDQLEKHKYYYRFDISKDYTQCFLDLEHENYPISNYEDFFEDYTHTNIDNVTEGYYLLEGYELKCGFWLKDGKYPHFFIRKLHKLGELDGTKIKKYMKTQHYFSGKKLAEFVTYIFQNFEQKSLHV